MTQYHFTGILIILLCLLAFFGGPDLEKNVKKKAGANHEQVNND